MKLLLSFASHNIYSTYIALGENTAKANDNYLRQAEANLRITYSILRSAAFVWIDERRVYN
jgi:hypothetical protein